MILMPDTVISVLLSGADMRISAIGLMPDTMQKYAIAAKQGGSHISFVVGDAILMPQTMQAIGSVGKGHVSFDFVSKR